MPFQHFFYLFFSCCPKCTHIIRILSTSFSSPANEGLFSLVRLCLCYFCIWAYCKEDRVQISTAFRPFINEVALVPTWNPVLVLLLSQEVPTFSSRTGFLFFFLQTTLSLSKFSLVLPQIEKSPKTHFFSKMFYLLHIYNYRTVLSYIS